MIDDRPHEHSAAAYAIPSFAMTFWEGWVK